MNNSIQMKRGTKLSYNSLATKDGNTLYYITDTGEIYLGEKLMSISDLSKYVVKEDGKVLSSNDFTDELKSKLESIDTFSSIDVNGTTIVADSSEDKLSIVSGDNISITADVERDTITISTTYTNASESSSGLMSAADKVKLNNISENANNYSLPAATASSLGGIKVGAGLKISDGVLSTNNPNLDGIRASSNDINILEGANSAGVDSGDIQALSGVTGNIQDQINSKSDKDHKHPEFEKWSFGKVSVGATDISADMLQDQLTLVEGSGITIIPDTDNDKITISVNEDLTGSVKLASDLSKSDDGITHANTVTPDTASEGGESRILSHGGTFNIPSITYDSNGHVTAKDSTTLTLPAQYVLPAASSTARGGVKVGFSESGSKIPVKVSSEEEKMYVELTDSSISAGGGITKIVAGNGLTGTTESGAATLNIAAGSGITVTAEGINVNTGYTTSGKKYKVEADSTSGGLYVNVPWTNTTYTAGTGLSLSGSSFSVKTGYTTSGKNYAVKAHTDGNLYVSVPWTDTVYTHPSYTAKSSGLYKVTVNSTGHVSAATAVVKSDITALGIPGQDTVYTHPSYTTEDSGLYKVKVDNGHVSEVTAVTKADITALGIPGQDTNTAHAHEAGNGIKLSGAGGITSDATIISLAEVSNVEGSYGPISAVTGSNGATINVPYITVDKYGRVISISNKVYTSKDTIYTHPAHTAKASGLYKVTVDAQGHVSAATAVAKSDITALGIPAQDTVYTHPSYTAKSSGLYKVTVDSTGHVSGATSVTGADITNLGITALDWGSF